MEFQSDDFSYKVINSSEKTVEITDYLGYSTELTIPHAVTYNDVTYSVVSIGSEAFKQSAFLMTVSIPNSIKTIGTSAFSGCSSLTAINIPNSVTSIQASTFSDCSSLASINIPTPVTSIGDRAFYGCYSMTEVTIGNRVTSIGAAAFEGCFSLTQITIPNSVKSIGSSAFEGCDALTQVNIGSSVTSIGYGAFSGCSALAEMTVLATVPPTVGADAFYNVSRNIPVYVPAEALEDYQAAKTWKEFNYLQAMPTALQTPAMPESMRVYGGLLHNPQQLPVSIYDMQGRMVYSGTAATVSQPAGVYVVRCAGASGKVLF